MKKLLLFFMLLTFIFVQNITKPVFAETGCIVVNNTEIAEIEPNVATITFTIETTDVDSKKASEKNNEIATNVINKLKEILASDNKSMIQTNRYNLRPNYQIKNDNNEKIIKNYTVTNTIFVKTSIPSMLSTLIDVAVKNNVSRVGDINFVLDNKAQFQKDLVNIAIKKAYDNAKSYAATLNQKVTGIKSLEVNTYQQSNNTSCMYAASKSVNSLTPVETGKVKLNATVNVSFFVK